MDGENYIFKGGRKDVLLPISFTIYLIQTENKNILVDVGCDDGAGFEMSIFKKPVDILKEYGLSPNDITDVIITHSPTKHFFLLYHIFFFLQDFLVYFIFYCICRTFTFI